MIKNYLLIICIFLLLGCDHTSTLFERLPSSHTGISFNNRITENDSVNPLDLEFLYNGGGVAVGDFNNDSLPDLYFTASTEQNELYLNQGGLTFKNVTAPAKVNGEGMWSNAASVVDINNDGLQDIYVCTTIKSDPQQRKNLLYVNQGLNNDKIPVFKEMAEAYGLADTSFSVQGAFFDYDNDSDLDMYLVTTRLVKRESASLGGNKTDAAKADIDKLFRNEWNDSLKHPVYKDISKEAGITKTGFGLGISVVDINKDGWKDVYVTNDFFGSDHLYINNRNGEFTDRVKDYFKHTSQNAMGNDIGDINNDGLQDIVAVDMNPEDNFRKKKNMGGNNYFIYQKMLSEYLELQYVRNTLQLNMGPSVGSNDSIGEPVFSETGFYSGIAETDWSWNASLADFDNDGYRDLIITNGYPRDVTDHDFLAFRNRSLNIATKQQLIDQMPQIKIPNYAYRNTGNLKFENATSAWGMTEPSFSNGAVYADLDNDGDLDYVINNINDNAFVYENTLNTKDKVSANYLAVDFKGYSNNKDGIGAIATIFYDQGKMQVYENSPYRGYLSTVDTKAFFGLGNITVIDSLVVDYGDKKLVLRNVAADQTVIADITQAVNETNDIQQFADNTLFSDITSNSGIHSIHHEMDYIDFNLERLIPHKLSQYGPGLAAADVDGNGLDDVFIGGTGDYRGKFLMQQPNGKFVAREIPLPASGNIRRPENMGLLLFDADADGDIDLYCASGSNESPAGTKNYQDQFFVNDGKGNFLIDTLALPVNYTSKSCVKAADFDNDGDLDIFLGGRVYPGKYPQPVSSFIYRNDSKPGKIKFTDITSQVAGMLQQIGMVCDALWTDFNNDEWIDLIIAGEWMPLTFLKNDHGVLKNITAETGIANEKGWWNSITGCDLDNDGDIDYVAGNLGENSFFRASHQYPLNIYAKDFDGNGSFDIIPVIYLKDENGGKREYTVHNRDDIVEQLPALKKRFLTYKDFATSDLTGIFPTEQLKDALRLQANNFKTSIIRNLGDGRFELVPLPAMAQLAPVYGATTDDVNNDTNPDIILCGNDFGNEVTNGRYDALNGLVMLGDGKGNFLPKTILQSGIFIPGDAKALIKFRGANNRYLIAASQNRDRLKLFSLKDSSFKIVPLEQRDRSVLIHFKNGQARKEELYHGNSFLSQSSSFVLINQHVKMVEIINNKRERRIIDF